MAKKKKYFKCLECSFETPQWMGKCPECGQWNSLEEKENLSEQKTVGVRATDEIRDAVSLLEVGHEGAEKERDHTGISEVNRCLGGGLTHGSLVLLGGDPGIGKSTLVLQMIVELLKGHPQKKALYVSGEESLHQINGRARRIVSSKDQNVFENLFLLSETNLEKMEAQIKKHQPEWIVVDSIQTSYSSDVPSGSGSVNQVREVALRSLHWSKEMGASVFLIGHVTKGGTIAGPKLLEHMVDTVLYFEGEQQTGLRLLRTVKNRFGGTSEVGLFEMGGKGLREVVDPGELYRTLREEKLAVSGSSLCCVIEGSRPFVAEVQALVGTQSVGNGRRTTSGVEAQRASIVSAVLEKYANIKLMDRDLFVASVGGIKITDPASDLALAVSMLSSSLNKPVPPDLAFLGEVTLTGEIRNVSWLESRLHELKRLGFKKVVTGPQKEKTTQLVETRSVRTISELVHKIW